MSVVIAGLKARKAVQAMIRNFGSQSIKVDGAIGPATRTAFSALPAALQRLVKEVAEATGVALERREISISELERLSVRVSRETGVPYEYLLYVVSVENPPVSGGYEIETEGKFRGLGQFDRVTWQSVMSIPWTEVGKPIQDLRAIASLYKANQRSYRKGFGKVKGYTDQMGYLYHNQGASAAKQFLTTGIIKYPKQSRKALQSFAIAKGQFDERNKSGSIT